MPRPTPIAGQPGVGPVRAQIPNALVFLRLAIAVVLFAILAQWSPPRGSGPGDPDFALLIAAALFIVAALTDALDGHLARKWGVVSAFGRVMDPFADKVLVLGTFALLAGPNFAIDAIYEPVILNSGQSGPGTEPVYINFSLSAVQPWMILVLLGRELLVTSLRGVVEARGGDFSATWPGKAKMIVQSAAAPAILIALALDPVAAPLSSELGIFKHAVAWITIVVTAWSAVPYAIQGFMALRGPLWFTPRRDDPFGPRRLLAIDLLTVNGLGLLRPAPGTWGSLPPIFLAAALIAAGYGPEHHPLIFHAIIIALLLASSYACLAFADMGEGIFGKKDAGQIVVDETAGQCVALLAFPTALLLPPFVATGEFDPVVPAQTVGVWETALLLAVAFFAFRLFDIIKPWPINKLQRLPGGVGVLIDDLLAGLLALGVVQAVAHLLF